MALIDNTAPPSSFYVPPSYATDDSLGIFGYDKSGRQNGFGKALSWLPGAGLFANAAAKKKARQNGWTDAASNIADDTNTRLNKMMSILKLGGAVGRGLSGDIPGALQMGSDTLGNIVALSGQQSPNYQELSDNARYGTTFYEKGGKVMGMGPHKMYQEGDDSEDIYMVDKETAREIGIAKLLEDLSVGQMRYGEVILDQKASIIMDGLIEKGDYKALGEFIAAERCTHHDMEDDPNEKEDDMDMDDMIPPSMRYGGKVKRYAAGGIVDPPSRRIASLNNSIIARGLGQFGVEQAPGQYPVINQDGTSWISPVQPLDFRVASNNTTGPRRRRTTQVKPPVSNVTTPAAPVAPAAPAAPAWQNPSAAVPSNLIRNNFDTNFRSLGDVANNLAATTAAQNPEPAEIRGNGLRNLIGGLGENVTGQGVMDTLGTIGRLAIGANMSAQRLPSWQRPARWNQYVDAAEQLSRQGYTPAEIGLANNQLNDSYNLAAQNIAGVSGGSSGSYLAALGQAQNNRIQGGAQLAASDAAMRRSNFNAYGNVLGRDTAYDLQEYQNNYQNAAAQKNAGLQLIGQTLRDQSERQAFNQTYRPGGAYDNYMNALAEYNNRTMNGLGSSRIPGLLGIGTTPYTNAKATAPAAATQPAASAGQAPVQWRPPMALPPQTSAVNKTTPTSFGEIMTGFRGTTGYPTANGTQITPNGLPFNTWMGLLR